MVDAAPDPLPAWADPALSHELVRIAAAGESQQVEFKAAFPKQASDLAKEIAAFATSNDGTLYLGIADDGTIAGIEDGDDRAVREKLRQRIEGLCSGPIQPHVTPSLRFAMHDGRVVMAVEVRKGAQPVYYAGNVPYLRQLTAARPMTPHEVIEAVLAWHRGQGGDNDPKQAFLSGLASLIVNIEVHLGESQIRRLRPFAEDNRFMLKSLADQARDTAIETPAELADIRPELDAIADALDVIAHERPLLNRDRSDIMAALDDAANRAATIRKRWLPDRSFSEDSVEGLRQTVRMQADKLGQLALRARNLIVQHRLDDLRSEASEIGLILLTAATFGVGLGEEESRQALVGIARTLRELETRTIYADGGASMGRVVADLEAAAAALSLWVAQTLGA